MSEKSNEKDIQALAEFVKQNYWKVRNCMDYLDEYEECKSLKGKFQQYFLYGETLDCSAWKEDVENCEKPVDDYEAYASIIRHEDERLQKRIKAHVANNVWDKRKEPPSNWDTELPDYMKQKQEGSFKKLDGPGSFCIIF